MKGRAGSARYGVCRKKESAVKAGKSHAAGTVHTVDRRCSSEACLTAASGSVGATLSENGDRSSAFSVSRAQDDATCEPGSSPCCSP